jgi:hypothetical protein
VQPQPGAPPLRPLEDGRDRRRAADRRLGELQQPWMGDRQRAGRGIVGGSGSGRRDHGKSACARPCGPSISVSRSRPSRTPSGRRAYGTPRRRARMQVQPPRQQPLRSAPGPRLRRRPERPSGRRRLLHQAGSMPERRAVVETGHRRRLVVGGFGPNELTPITVVSSQRREATSMARPRQARSWRAADSRTKLP